jgi:hypothetical protein
LLQHQVFNTGIFQVLSGNTLKWAEVICDQDTGPSSMRGYMCDRYPVAIDA